MADPWPNRALMFAGGGECSANQERSRLLHIAAAAWKEKTDD